MTPTKTRTIQQFGIRLVLGSALFLCCHHASGQSREDEIVEKAETVFKESMTQPGNAIPQAMLADAHGVAVIPNVIKGGFVIGARHGTGLLFVRDADGTWHAPVFISLTGGNVGWQAGVQSSDVILVFKTAQSVQGILDGKLTLGADAGAAAGPLGLQASAGTDGQLKAEIYTYSHSRGLFAGVSIDGSVIRTDRFATANYYKPQGEGQPVVVPPAALRLTQSIVTAAAKPNGQQPPAVAQGPAAQNTRVMDHHGTTDADVIREQLVEAAPQLYHLLDDQWKNYLALPANLYREDTHLTARELAPVLQNFQSVVDNPQLRVLADRPEFQSVFGVLKHYAQSLQESSGPLQLPPPPGAPTGP